MNIFYKDGEIATKNLTPGIRVYDEKLIKERESTEKNLESVNEYRIWNPRRSKLAAALLNGLKDFNLNNDSKVLYLGASTGTTVSHISDLCDDGLIYAVEFSPVSAKKLVRLSQRRNNIAPILADATKPKYYLNKVEKVDLVYCDVAQEKQSELFMNNMNLFLKEDGQGLITIKARSIDVIQKPKKIFKDEAKKIKENGYSILEKIKLEPYEKDHIAFLVEKSF
ncbi:fibrillarin-like rRNA/tRNA 2'-O-methyltransferase [Methanobrevibacter olleyae]|uniref:Fibrillarin-like rRNA/tRNA 2'-O-methyltransferase n=1 Tax=Methanobrevibacter olleyae TaxID=294671 RepID=A0A126R1S0_METOL|nr:fibrillarin-like rRNA/tRNA 2'-O-methyltransferase [Methanobrevibacter olleyae]AMK15984.1 fibrillarin FlpA [Methanobrevibacter olleyae]SFL16853.1 fibrillarin-like pre-rRNA processing protein [Methanobrevibacter olleyae]